MNFLPVCGSQCHILCNNVLGRWHCERLCYQAEQTGKESCSEVGMKLDSVLVATERRIRGKAASYNGQSLSQSPHWAEATQVHVQPQTHPTTCLKMLGGLFRTISCQTTEHNHHNSHNSSLHWLRTQPHTVRHATCPPTTGCHWTLSLDKNGEVQNHLIQM